MDLRDRFTEMREMDLQVQSKTLRSGSCITAKWAKTKPQSQMNHDIINVYYIYSQVLYIFSLMKVRRIVLKTKDARKLLHSEMSHSL